MTAKRFLMFYDAPSAVKFVENQIKGDVDKLVIKDFVKRGVTAVPTSLEFDAWFEKYRYNFLNTS